MMATPPKPRVRSEYLASTATRCSSAFAKTLGLKQRDLDHHHPMIRLISASSTNPSPSRRRTVLTSKSQKRQNALPLLSVQPCRFARRKWA